MIIRKYAGGVVFSGDKVLLSKDEKDKWMLPRGKVGNGELSNEVVKRKLEESGVLVEFVSNTGHTNYKYCSNPRQNPFCDKITWYIMKAQQQNDNFFKIDEAMKLIEGNEEKSLINLFFKKYTGEESMFSSL